VHDEILFTDTSGQSPLSLPQGVEVTPIGAVRLAPFAPTFGLLAAPLLDLSVVTAK